MSESFGGLTGPYDVIVADPPWLYKKQPALKHDGVTVAKGGSVAHHYLTLTNEQLRDLPVRDLAASDSFLFLWMTNPGIYGNRFSDVTPFHIAKAWGFVYRTMLTWVKTTAAGTPSGGGLGWHFRGCTEHVLYCTRGKAGVPSGLREPNVIMAPATGHSKKPLAFMEMVERVTTGSRLELFARTERAGWDSWGNELESSE